MKRPEVKEVPGEPLRYMVASATRDMWHLVDLAEWAGNGACSCEYFEFNAAPLLKLGAKPGARTRCRHIKIARDALCDRVIEEICTMAANKPARGEAEESTTPG